MFHVVFSQLCKYLWGDISNWFHSVRSDIRFDVHGTLLSWRELNLWWRRKLRAQSVEATDRLYSSWTNKTMICWLVSMRGICRTRTRMTASKGTLLSGLWVLCSSLQFFGHWDTQCSLRLDKGSLTKLPSFLFTWPLKTQAPLASLFVKPFLTFLLQTPDCLLWMMLDSWSPKI